MCVAYVVSYGMFKSLTTSAWLLAGGSVATADESGLDSTVGKPGLPGGGDGSVWSCSK